MGLKLLIADDEETIRNGMSRYIQLHTDRFEKIYLAEDGRVAYDMIMQYKPDIILLDIQMPYMSGVEIMKELDKVGLKIPIILLSGYDEFQYAQQALRLGAKEYMLKPSRSSDILQRILQIAENEYGIESTAEVESANPFVQQACEYIKEHYFENLTLSSVAEQLGITPGYLSTLFSKHMNMSFVDYLNKLRIDMACMYLRQNFLKTYEIAYKVGFRDEKYFSKVFKKIKKVSPKEYRQSKHVE